MDRQSIVTHELLELAASVAKQHHVSLECLLGGRRYGNVSLARAHFLYEAKDRIGSYAHTARVVGMDHTSVMAARSKS